MKNYFSGSDKNKRAQSFIKLQTFGQNLIQNSFFFYQKFNEKAPVSPIVLISEKEVSFIFKILF